MIGRSLIIFGELEFLTRRYCKHGKFKIVQFYQYHISKLVRGERKQLHKDRGGIRGEGIMEIHDEKLWESWDEKKKANNFVGTRTTFKPALSNSVVLALRTREKFG